MTDVASGERAKGDKGLPRIGALRNGGLGEAGSGTAVGEGRLDWRYADLIGMGGGGGVRSGIMGWMGGARFGDLGGTRGVVKLDWWGSAGGIARSARTSRLKASDWGRSLTSLCRLTQARVEMYGSSRGTARLVFRSSVSK